MDNNNALLVVKIKINYIHLEKKYLIVNIFFKLWYE